MTEKKGNRFNVSTDIPPEKLETSKITDDSLVIHCQVRYRGKSNSYIKEKTYIKMMVDRSGQEIDGVWDKKWTTVSPGVETCGNDGTYTRQGKHEYMTTESIRIHCKACPLYVHFLETYEYIDYDGLFNRTHSRDYWVRYEY